MKFEILSYIKNNKKIVVLLLLGILLVFVGNLFSVNNDTQMNFTNQPETERLNKKELEKILSNIEGAGNVRLFITYENSGVTEYAVDTKTVTNSGESNEKKHVFSNKEPIVNSYTNANIRGVIVTATGANTSDVKNRLIRCIKAVTGVGYDRISVEIGVR